MARRCLFCPRPADSAEHIWPDWILEDLKPAEPIRVRIGKRADVWTDNPEVLVKCVCEQCNNHWMSDLESDNKPHIYPMLHDQKTTLVPAQQKLLARWAVLKAMVIRTANRKLEPFYLEEERLNIKPPSFFIPVGTFVWIGRYFRSGFHAGGTDIWRQINNVPKAFHGCVTSIVMGHLVIQVLTGHVRASFANHPAFNVDCEPWKWDVSLLNIWPVLGAVDWPPPVSFTHKWPNHIWRLVKRFSLGNDIGT